MVTTNLAGKEDSQTTLCLRIYGAIFKQLKVVATILMAKEDGQTTLALRNVGSSGWMNHPNEFFDHQTPFKEILITSTYLYGFVVTI
jgi:hypothetical protein